MGNQDDSGSSLPRYGWSGTNQQFASGGKQNTPTSTLYKNAGLAVAAGAAAVVLTTKPSTTPDPIPYTSISSPDAVERKLTSSGGGGGGGGGGNPGTPVNTPSTETSINQININEQTMTDEAFTDLILEDIGGRELITLSRHWDLIGTSVPVYSPIKNISSVLFANSPINIAPNPNSTIDFFDTFSLLLSSYLPTDAELNALDADYKKSYVYYEPSINSIIINTANIFNNEGVQVEFITFDSLKDDTIYP
jgi:hypothetical protein